MFSIHKTKGIPQEDLHKLRYQCVVIREGKQVFLQVFHWSYSGGSLSPKEYLFNNGLSAAQYRKTFNAHQRQKMDSNEPVSSYDITLLYLLLQRVCDLEKDVGKWILTENPDDPTLENCLYNVKNHRNVLAHEDQKMSESDMNEKLSELQNLFATIIRKAGERFSKSDAEIEEQIAILSKNIESLRKTIREPLNAACLVEYQKDMKEIREQLKYSVEQAAQEELYHLYRRLYEIDPAPWLLMDLQVRPTQIFTRFLLEKDDINTSNTSEEEQQKEIPYDSILQVKRKDGSLPGVLILTGEGGMGKTTYLKYLTEMWTEDPYSVFALDEADLLLYIECRHPSISSFNDLLKNLLHDTTMNLNVEFEFIRDVVLHMQLLILVDGFDEINKASEQLIREVLSLPGDNVRILVTTRPGNTEQLTKLIPHSKRRLNLILNGITPNYHEQFVSKLVCCLTEEDQHSKIEEHIGNQMGTLKQQLGTHLNNPLTLTLLTLLFIKDPDGVNSLTTTTELYETLRTLLTDKLIERLNMKSFDSDLSFKLSQFLEYSDELSFYAMQHKEFELQRDTVEKLKRKCRDLALPHTEVMSTYFTVRRSRQGVRIVLYFTYHHLRIQEFSVAKHLVKSISDSANADDLIRNFLKDAEKLKYEERFQSILVQMTGLLSQGHEDILERYSSHLFSIVPLSSAGILPVLTHVTESKLNHHVVKAAAVRLDDHTREWSTWWIKNSNSLGVIPAIMDKVQLCPHNITLRLQYYSDSCPLLDSALTAISRRDSRLVLDLPKYYLQPQFTPVDTLIFKTSHSEAICSLVGFRGPLSTVGIMQLPECLEELRLRTDSQGLRTLNDRLPCLHQLSILGIKYDEEDKCKASSVPALLYSGQKLCLTFVPHVTDAEEDLQWAATVVTSLCGARDNKDYSSILFLNSDMTWQGGEKLLQILHRNEVKVTHRLDITTTQRITKEGSQHLNRLALSFKLGNVLFHKP